MADPPDPTARIGSVEQDRNAAVFRGGSYDSAPANIKQFIDQFEIGVLTTPFESDLYFGKLSWQLTSKDRISGTYTDDPTVYAKLLDLGVMSFATDHPDVTLREIKAYYAARKRK